LQFIARDELPRAIGACDRWNDAARRRQLASATRALNIHSSLSESITGGCKAGSGLIRDQETKPISSMLFSTKEWLMPARNVFKPPPTRNRTQIFPSVISAQFANFSRKSHAAFLKDRFVTAFFWSLRTVWRAVFYNSAQIFCANEQKFAHLTCVSVC
jgi:hypothetical protein